MCRSPPSATIHAQREADALREQLEALQAAQPTLTRRKRPRGRARRLLLGRAEGRLWFDENGKPFELADHPARKRLAALQPSARQRCRRPSRSSPKPFAHSTPMLHIVHLVRLLYIPTTPTTPPTPPPHLATVLPY
jgi:hypothetical protein